MLENRSMPPGEIIPEIPYADVRQAVDWLCSRFGFSERLRIGDHRAQLSYGQSSVVITKQGGGPSGGTAILVRVADVDGHYERAARLGAKILNPPADYPYGERQYSVEDPGGHRWTFSQTVRDVDPGEWGGVLLDEG